VSNEAPHVLPAGKLASVDHEAMQLTVCFEPRVCRQRQGIEVLGTQGFLDFDHDQLGLGNETVGNTGSFGERIQPLDGLVTLFIAENAHWPWHQEADNLGQLPDPTNIGHDRAAVEQPQRAKPDLDVFPRCARGDAVEVRGDLAEESNAAPLL
jgi:hypothetical protein